MLFIRTADGRCVIYITYPCNYILLTIKLLGAIRTPLELPIIFPRLLVPLNGASMIISVLSVFNLLNSFMNEFKQIAVEFKDSNVTSIGRI